MSERAVEALTRSPEETMSLAAALADLFGPCDVLALQGTLGAGKTCFVKGLAHGLGVADERQVASPTFVLMRRHEGRLPLFHFDAYRLRGAAEMESIGCAEAFESGGVSVVEWADHVAGCLPREHFALSITVTGPSERRLMLTARGAGPQARMAAFRAALAPWAR
jgi:tRNA threonylcarbamoyladenosine biosynthesis protein TsaE